MPQKRWPPAKEAEEAPKPANNDASSLTRRGIAILILRSATLFLESPKCADTLLHWRKEVEKPKVEACLRSKDFVIRLVNDIRKERGCVGMLVEISKALMNVDHTAARNVGAVCSLHVLLPQALKPRNIEDYYDDKGGNDPRCLVVELVPFLFRQLRLQGSGRNQLPKHASENVLDMLIQVWRHLREEAMPPDEVPAMIACLEEMMSEWNALPTSVLAASSVDINRALNIVHMYVRRSLELFPDVIHVSEYNTTRRLLCQLQKNMQVQAGQWTRLAVLPLHSALPSGPVKARVEPEPGEAAQPPQSASSLMSTLKGWVKVGPGRIRPWSADFQLGRPGSPNGNLPMPWLQKQEPALDSCRSDGLASALKQSESKFGGLQLGARSFSRKQPPKQPVSEKWSNSKSKRLASAITIQRMLRKYMEKKQAQRERQHEIEVARENQAATKKKMSSMLDDLRYMQRLAMPVGGPLQILVDNSPDSNDEEELTEAAKNDLALYLK